MSAGEAHWPFAAWHRTAITQLGLSPDQFWAMPLADWLALIRSDRAPMSGAQLLDLLKDHPDD